MSWPAELHARYGEKSDEELESENLRVAMAGRMMAERMMGKASFAHSRTCPARSSYSFSATHCPKGSITPIQEVGYRRYRRGRRRAVQVPRQGELSVKVDSVQLLTKSLRPLPGEVARA